MGRQAWAECSSGLGMVAVRVGRKDEAEPDVTEKLEGTEDAS